MSEEHKFPPINLPPFDMKLSTADGSVKVFDPLRKKYVALTPEEYVRQHFVNYLTTHLNYPAALMANETAISLNGTVRRPDTIVYRAQGDPLMIVEYKAPGIAISQNVFDQIVRYNMALKAKYLVVSNGLRHYCCVIDYHNNSYNFIPKIPDYRDIVTDHSIN